MKLAHARILHSPWLAALMALGTPSCLAKIVGDDASADANVAEADAIPSPDAAATADATSHDVGSPPGEDASSGDATACIGCDRVVDIALGAFGACALHASGGVSCWGTGTAVGDGTATHTSCSMMVDCSPVPVRVAGITDAVEITAGDSHACARRASGSVVCWGTNWSGQLGDGTRIDRTSPVPVVGLDDAVEISAAWRFTCARRSSGAVVCWGGNDGRELGDGVVTHSACGATDCSPTPVTVAGLTDATSIAAGWAHSCARRASGSVVCWGQNGFGQLGDGTTVDRPTPVTVTGLTDVSQLAIGGDHTCALASDGSVTCWGGNYDGLLGDGAAGHVACTIGALTRDCSPVPIRSSLVPSAVQIAARNYHACARRSSGEVLCWGQNDSGSLGDGLASHMACTDGFDCSIVPVTVSALTDAVDIDVGWAHSCALRATGAIVCWGDNSTGQLGNGTTANSSIPVTVRFP